MATELDVIFVPKALELIERFGKDLTFRAKTKVYDPTTSKTTYGPETDIVRKGTPPDQDKLEFSAGDVVRFASSHTWIAASGLTFDPTIGQFVTYDGKKHTVLACGPIYSGDEIALWELWLGR